MSLVPLLGFPEPTAAAVFIKDHMASGKTLVNPIHFKDFHVGTVAKAFNQVLPRFCVGVRDDEYRVRYNRTRLSAGECDELAEYVVIVDIELEMNLQRIRNLIEGHVSFQFIEMVSHELRGKPVLVFKFERVGHGGSRNVGLPARDTRPNYPSHPVINFCFIA